MHTDLSLADLAAWARPTLLGWIRYYGRFHRSQIETCDVVAEVLIGNVVNLPALALLMLHHHSHRNSLSLEVRLQTTDIRGLAFRVRKHQDACHPIHCLQRERPLTVEVGPAAFPPDEEFGMPRLGLRQPAFGAGRLPFDFRSGAPDLFVGPLQ